MTFLEKTPVNIEEARAWILAHKASTRLSWPAIARAIGEKMADSTLSLFANDKYIGHNDKIAEAISRYRTTYEEQVALSFEAPKIPGFIKTRTAATFLGILSWAHRGRIVSVSGGPGTGKSWAIRHYAETNSAAYVISLSPTMAGVNNLLLEVLTAIGRMEDKGPPQQMSAAIRKFFTRHKGLLIFDEAQNLSEKAMEEIRSWWDATGVGIALFGNHHVVSKLAIDKGGVSMAQLTSRISWTHDQLLPKEEDIRDLLAEWGVEDEAQIKFLLGRGSTAGGLRNITMELEAANFLASSEGRKVTLRDLKEAAEQHERKGRL